MTVSTPALRQRLLACGLALSAAAALGANARLDELMSHDGLRQISVKGLDLVYARPGAVLSTYKQVMLDPTQVSFSKSWAPKRPGSALPLPESDREAIRSGVARIVHEEFVRELQSNSGYRIVDAAGPDVLRVRADIANLIVNAPDVASASRSRSYTLTAGEMTLVAELIDSETGQVQARLVDRREARRSGHLQLSLSVDNLADARSIAATWARTLRQAMDRAHGIAAK
jgi:Protein of unknown function (DUF3313)